MDVHQRDSQVCELDPAGGVLGERRMRTERGRLAAVFGARAPARILLEASTESEWVAQTLEALGHEVIVADPNYAPMYATRQRRVKTDRRDARTLAEACRLGAYRAAHRPSAPRRAVRAQLAVRDVLVRTRVRYIVVVRALLRQAGIALPSGSTDTFVRRLDAVSVPAPLAATVAPLRTLLEALTAQIAAADARITATLAGDPVARRLTTAPGVGPLTAVAFVATLDTIERFPSASQVTAYLGLVPQERSSGEQRHRGALTKAGNKRVRWLLVQAAWGIWRSRAPDSEALRAWARAVAMRRGKRVAVVALARRLARILYALWRDGATYTSAPVPAALAVAS
jgi:transposase